VLKLISHYLIYYYYLIELQIGVLRGGSDKTHTNIRHTANTAQRSKAIPVTGRGGRRVVR
jgi:hypothetical protein